MQESQIRYQVDWDIERAGRRGKIGSLHGSSTLSKIMHPEVPASLGLGGEPDGAHCLFVKLCL